jgi:hypothetical protein
VVNSRGPRRLAMGDCGRSLGVLVGESSELAGGWPRNSTEPPQPRSAPSPGRSAAGVPRVVVSSHRRLALPVSLLLEVRNRARFVYHRVGSGIGPGIDHTGGTPSRPGYSAVVVSSVEEEVPIAVGWERDA